MADPTGSEDFDGSIACSDGVPPRPELREKIQAARREESISTETKPPSAPRGGWPSFAAARRADAGTVRFQEETPSPMRIPSPVRRSWLLPLAALGLGCSSTGGLVRSGNDPKIQTIASVGDRPVATKAGTDLVGRRRPERPRLPADSRRSRLGPRRRWPRRTRAQRPSPGRRRRALGRAGRRGHLRPRRRLHAPRAPAGVELHADRRVRRAGGLGRGPRRGPRPLHGHRDRRSGRRTPGRPPPRRAFAVGPDRLRSDRDRRPARHVLTRQRRRPARRHRRRPGRRHAGEEGSASGHGRRHGLAPSRAAKKTSNASTPSALDDRATLRASTLPADEGDDPLPRATRRVADDPPADDEENPLPPAIESGGRRSRGGDDPDPEPAAPRPRSTRRVSQAKPQRPGPTPGALTSAKDDFTTTIERTASPAVSPILSPSPSRLTNTSTSPRPPPRPSPPSTTPSPRPRSRRPGKTLGRVEAGRTAAIPRRRRRRRLRAEGRSRARPGSPRRLWPIGPRRPAPSLKEAGSQVEACRYDASGSSSSISACPTSRAGRSRSSDFDADFILLDFWGTWCRPCLSSVPHLMDLQKRYEGRKLAVVGIACERDRRLRARPTSTTSRSGWGSTTPCSSAARTTPEPRAGGPARLRLPTMVLIDRKGRVRWRTRERRRRPWRGSTASWASTMGRTPTARR